MTIKAYDPQGNIFLGNATLDPLTGNYSILITSVGHEKLKPEVKSSLKSLGNPFTGMAAFEMYAPKNGNYVLKEFDNSSIAVCFKTRKCTNILALKRTFLTI